MRADIKMTWEEGAYAMSFDLGPDDLSDEQTLSSALAMAMINVIENSDLWDDTVEPEAPHIDLIVRKKVK